MGDAVSEDFFPVATDREYLLSTVFGKIPAFTEPQNRAEQLQKYEGAARDLKERLDVCRREMHELYGYERRSGSKNGAIRALALSVRPVPMAQKRKRLGEVVKKKYSKRAKRRARIAISDAERRDAVDATSGTEKTVTKVETKKEQTTQGPSTMVDGNAVQQQHPRTATKLGFPVTTVFSVSLLSNPSLVSDDLRQQLVAQYSTGGCGSVLSGVFDAPVTSPLASVPGLVRHVKALHLSTKSTAAYSRTWANKLHMFWPLCSKELTNGICTDVLCSFQHKRDYELETEEKWRYSRWVGEVDRQILMDKRDASFLHWPLFPNRRRWSPQDDIPVYHRQGEIETHPLPISFVETTSSLMRSVDLDHEKLKTKSIQLSMDYALVDVLDSFGSPDRIAITSNQLVSSPKESNEVKNEVDVLLMTLSMIEGDRCFDSASREGAIKLLSNKLAMYPHHRMLWRVYLGLFLRDSGESHQSKLHQAQLCDSLCGPCFRRSLMVASISQTSADKIATLKKTITSFLRDSQASSIPENVVACCIDLVLRMVYIELSTREDPFNDTSATCGALLACARYVCQSGSKARMNIGAQWILTLWRVLQAHPEQGYVFFLALIHARLYGKLPPSIVHSLGFPKKSKVITWTAKSLDKEMWDVMNLLKLATNARQHGRGFFDSMATSPGSVLPKRVLLVNVLLLFEACNVTNPIQQLRSILPQCDLLRGILDTTPYCVLHIAELLDCQIERCCQMPPVEHEHGLGFILERTIAGFEVLGKTSIIDHWMQNRSLYGNPLNQGVLLMMSKNLLAVDSVSSDLKLVDGAFLEVLNDLDRKQITGKEPSQHIRKSDRFFTYLSAFFDCIVKKKPFCLESFARHATKLSESSPVLAERVAMEMITLAVAALPHDDPRKATTRTVQDPEVTHLDAPLHDPEVSFPCMTDYLKRRQTSFSVVLSLLKTYVEDHVTSVVALGNVQEDLGEFPDKVRSVLESPTMHECDVLLDQLRILIPYLHENEVWKIVEFLFARFPSSPAFADFLLDIHPCLPSYGRSCFRVILTVLLRSVPCPGFDVWEKAVSAGSVHGQSLVRDLKSLMEKYYPNWNTE